MSLCPCSAPLCASCFLQRISNLKICNRRRQQLAVHAARGHPPYLQNSVTYQSLFLYCCWIWKRTWGLQARKCTPTSRASKQASKLRQGSGKPQGRQACVLGISRRVRKLKGRIQECDQLWCSQSGMSNSTPAETTLTMPES